MIQLNQRQPNVQQTRGPLENAAAHDYYCRTGSGQAARALIPIRPTDVERA